MLLRGIDSKEMVCGDVLERHEGLIDLKRLSERGSTRGAYMVAPKAASRGGGCVIGS